MSGYRGYLRISLVESHPPRCPIFPVVSCRFGQRRNRRCPFLPELPANWRLPQLATTAFINSNVTEPRLSSRLKRRAGRPPRQEDRMAIEPEKTKCIATWWDDSDPQNPAPNTEPVEIEVHWEGDAFFIDGLREGHYLSVPLYGIVKPMADSSAPTKGLAR